MPDVNAVGDVVLTDPAAMRALADPIALALLDSLRRAGPATAAQLAGRVEATPTAIEETLGRLEAFELVSRHEPLRGEEDRWEAVGKGFVFEIPEEPEGQAAARALSNAMYLKYVDLPRRWLADDEPRLELERIRAAGLFNARVRLTPGELRGLQEALESLLEPFITRGAGDLPPEAGPTRILAYFLPEPPPG